MLDRDDLTHIWFCRECGAQFFFLSDVTEHTEMTKHKQITKIAFKEFEGLTP